MVAGSGAEHTLDDELIPVESACLAVPVCLPPSKTSKYYRSLVSFSTFSDFDGHFGGRQMRANAGPRNPQPGGWNERANETCNSFLATG